MTLESNLLHAICGALGSAASITILYPLETARTRLQVYPNLVPHSSLPLILSIYRREGLAALYRGWASLVLALMITNFVYFYVFHGLRVLWGGSGDDAAVSTDFESGLVAGVTAVLISNPFWVVNIRLKLQGVPGSHPPIHKGESKTREKKYRNVLDCGATIILDEGLTALWSGMSSSLLLVSNPTIQFAAYEALKRSTMFDLGLGVVLGHAANGAIAKVLATVATYPIQVIQTRRRAGLLVGDGWMRSWGVFGQLVKIVQQDGILGLFRGLETKLTQSCLTAAIMFFVYEELVRIIFAVADVER
jgi:adenine nucleotide transporter 17